MSLVSFYTSAAIAASGCSRSEEPEEPAFHSEVGLSPQAVPVFMTVLLRDGKVETSDGRTKVVFSDKIHKIKIIGSSAEELLAKDYTEQGAYTYFGIVGPNKEFSHGHVEIPGNEAAFLTIVNKNTRNDETYLGGVIAHELRHGFDFLKGLNIGYRNDIDTVLEGCMGDKETKRIVSYVLMNVTSEARAYLCQLDYFLANKHRFPKKEFEENIKKAVMHINIYFGIRNYIYKTHDLYLPGFSPEFSRSPINKNFDGAFEKAVPASMIGQFNAALRPYNIGISPKHVNSDNSNKALLRDLYRVDAWPR